MKKLLCVSMGFAHTCLLSKKYKLRVISVKMAERGPLGNYHVSETLKILGKKPTKKHAESTLSELYNNIQPEVYSSHMNA